MNKNEKIVLKDLSNLVDNEMNFNELSKNINYTKYKKEKKAFAFSRRMSFVLSSFVIVFAFTLVMFLIPNGQGSEIDFPNNPNLVDTSYEGFIKGSFESNIGEGPFQKDQGPTPAPPVIDGYFNEQMDNYSPDEGNPNSKPGVDSTLPIYFEMRSFEYIYEVEYSNIDIGLEYITAYIEKNLAEKISNECREVMDALGASSIDEVDGSIVDWFYSNEYYNKKKIFWCGYASSDQIYSEIDGYLCVGVYQPKKRTIIREIFSNIIVNISDNIYSNLYFKNEDKEFLTPIIDKSSNLISWYSSNNLINETNTFFLFDSCYGSKFDCVIDKDANTIKLETYAVQNEEELSKNYSKLLKDYHILSNAVILENDSPNEKLGETTYITYNYVKFVEILQELAKYK